VQILRGEKVKPGRIFLPMEGLQCFAQDLSSAMALRPDKAVKGRFEVGRDVNDGHVA
jgi:hypothetical protein